MLPKFKTIKKGKCIVALTFFLLLFCISLSQFPFYGKADEPLVASIGSEIYTAIWTFDNAEDFNATETIIDNSEVILRSYNYNWNQASKKDFEKGIENDVTITQKPSKPEIYSSEFESGDEGWEHGKLSGAKDEWQHGDVSEIPAFIGSHDPGSHVWGTNLSGKYDDSGGQASDYFLRSPLINLSDSMSTEMRFWHYYDFESDTNINDGGIIEISIDNGANWVQIFPKTGYDGQIEDPDNPLHDPVDPAYCFAGNSSAWVEERFDLSPYDGTQNFYVRFRFATNGQVSDYGWYIDNINITSTTISEGEVELGSRNIGIGNPPNNVKQRPENVTIIDPNNPVDHDGVLTEWTVFIANITTPAQGKMKIFREVGGEFIWVGETDFEDVVNGENTFTSSIDVKAGDYIGWYGVNANIYADSTFSPSAFSKDGNIYEDSPNSSWTPINFTISISADGQFRNPVGTLTSQVFDAGSPAIWEEISWSEDISSPGVDIVLYTRTGNDPDPTPSSWSPWSSDLTNPIRSTIQSPNGQYIQFMANLTTTQQPYTPTLFNVSISYRKYSPYGEVETNDLIPDGVVQWIDLSANENLVGQYITYNYSLDSGETWHPISEDDDLTSVSVLEGKIRLKVSLSTKDTTISPLIGEMSLTYSSATPDMGLFIEVDKNDVKPGDTVSYNIWYDNRDIGDAKDVLITLELDPNVSYWSDTSPIPPTIEGGNVIKWHFPIVNPGNRTFIVEAKVEGIKEETTISMFAVLNYTDLGGNSYKEVISNTITIKATAPQDFLAYYLLLVVIIAIILISSALLIRRRYKVLEERISLEDVEKGIGCLIMEENPTKSYTIFSDFIDEGHKGLCITRTFPGRVISNYSFEGVSILWLSRARDENNILPTNLSALLRSARDFMEANKEAVILLDGLEYLMVHNDFQRVLKLVHGLNELTAINDARLIIPLNPVALDKDKVAILKRDLKMLG
ncbi:MAG: DUF835 domain-containing protein [Thermoplasmata archaeon]